MKQHLSKKQQLRFSTVSGCHRGAGRRPRGQMCGQHQAEGSGDARKPQVAEQGGGEDVGSEGNSGYQSDSSRFKEQDLSPEEQKHTLGTSKKTRQTN